MIHANKLQDALNQPPLIRCTAYQKLPPPPPAFVVKYPANLNDKNAIWTNDIPSRLKSRKSFLRTVPPLNKHATHQLKILNLWQNYTDNIPDQHNLQNFPVQESLPPGYKLQWNKWRCLNRLRSGVGKTKSLLLKWGYLPHGTDTTCQCGKENQTMNHLLTCEKTGTTCTMDDLLQSNSNAKKSQRLGAT